MAKGRGRIVALARLVVVLLAMVFATSLLADDGDLPKNSVEHEYVPPDPREDVTLAATTLDGALPAALETRSGVATAPDPSRPPDAKSLYSGGTTDDGPASTYEPDLDTRQPNVENYEDPFSPSTSPFKRLRAFDTFDERYTLHVSSQGLSVVTVGGEANDEDEPFYADFSVDLLPGEPVRIPTVGPGQRALRIHTNPEATVTLLRDGADNWFIQGIERKRVRVVMEIAIERGIFGSEFPDVTWSSLETSLPPLPAATKRLANQVMERVGVSHEMTVPVALAKMVTYFRGFEPSNNPPHDNGDVYVDLALSRKGVCRHRAFAFFITALNLGIPTRMVVNEAHAWVEAFDGRIWHRIDLGGAALNLDNPPDTSKPQYTPPTDPFQWPEGSEDNSGNGLANRMRHDAGATDPAQTPDPSDPNNNGSSATPSPGQNGGSSSDLPASHLELETIDRTIRRGASLHIKGKVEAREPCAHVRVDVRMRVSDRRGLISIGALSTDDSGIFDGSVIVPRDIGTGDYDLTVSTRGDKRCGPGVSD